MCNRGFILGSKNIYCVECEFEDNCDYSFALYIDVGIEEYKTPDIDIQIDITSDDDFHYNPYHPFKRPYFLLWFDPSVHF